MKTKEEIEQLAEQWFNEEFLFKNRFYTNSKELRKGYENGYTQSQEDNKDKKYTEEDMLKCWNTAFIDAMNIDSETYKPIFYSDFINSLNKQD